MWRSCSSPQISTVYNHEQNYIKSKGIHHKFVIGAAAIYFFHIYYPNSSGMILELLEKNCKHAMHELLSGTRFITSCLHKYSSNVHNKKKRSPLTTST